MKKSKGVAIIAIILACLIGLGYYTSTIMTATSTSQKKTDNKTESCLLYTSPSPRDTERSRMPSSA